VKKNVTVAGKGEFGKKGGCAGNRNLANRILKKKKKFFKQRKTLSGGKLGTTSTSPLAGYEKRGGHARERKGRGGRSVNPSAEKSIRSTFR